jgi:hypothetical protein
MRQHLRLIARLETQLRDARLDAAIEKTRADNLARELRRVRFQLSQAREAGLIVGGVRLTPVSH